ncbi:diguanylate cyclase [Deinococcus malanensis]|nr:diguanylate cyclase [Deinococcus malanensis]
MTDPLKTLAGNSRSEELQGLNAAARSLVKDDPQKAWQEAAGLLQQAEELGDVSAQASALHTQALSRMEAGDQEQSQSLAELAAERYTLAAETPGYCEVQLLRTKFALSGNRPEEALSLCNDIIDRTAQDEPTTTLAEALLTKAMVLFRQGRHAEASSSLQHSGEVRLLLGDKAGHAKCLNNIGLIYEAAGDFAQALNSFMRCLEFLRTNDIAMNGLLSACLVNVGKVYRELGETDNAVDSLTRGVEIAEQARHLDQTGVYVSLAAGHSELGLIHRERRQFQEALDAFMQALHVTRSEGMRLEKVAKSGGALHEEAEVLDNIGQTYALMGETDQAFKALNQALQLSLAADDTSCQASVLTHLGSLYAKGEQYQQAIPLLRRALKFADAMALRRPALEAHEQLARALMGAGQATEAASHLLVVTELQRDLFRSDNERRLRNLTGQLELEKARYQADVYRQLNDVSLKARQEAEKEVQARTAELERAQLEIVNRLGLAAEYRDDKTGVHTYRVGNIAALLAEALGLPQAQVDLIRLAARLHDVGKIGIPDTILLKPGKFTPEEYEVMKHHTTIGARVLQGGRTELMHLAEQIALTHHERWDGQGYPRRLSGQDIPLAGRLVAVADVWDALTSERPYKGAWDATEALAELRAQAGRQFDPAIVEALVQLAENGDLERLDDRMPPRTEAAPDRSPLHLAETGPAPETHNPAFENVIPYIEALIKGAWQVRDEGPEALTGPSQQALELAHQYGYAPGVGYAQRNLAYAHAEQQQYSEAVDLLTKARMCAEQLSDKLLKRDCAAQLSRIYAHLLDPDRALSYALLSLEVSRALQDQAGEAQALLDVGRVYTTLEGREEQALDSIRGAATLFDGLSDLNAAASCRVALAQLHFGLGHLEEAAFEGRQALALAAGGGTAPVQVQALTVTARALEALGDWSSARALYQAAWDTGEPREPHMAEQVAWTGLYFARGLLRHGEPDEGERLLAHTLKLAHQHDLKDIAEQVCREHIGLYRARGDAELALAFQEQAHALEVEQFRQDNGRRALALTIGHHSDRVRAESDSFHSRSVELATTNVALEQANQEKTALLAALQEQTKVLERQSREDGLTGVYNRRHIEEVLAAEHSRHRQTHRPLSLIMIDIDHFKAVNDQFSHPVGDEVLRRVAKLFKTTCRADDLVGRYGGEEFLIVLPDTTVQQATEVAERIRRLVEDYPWREIHPKLRVTLSLGVCGRMDFANHERLLSLVDEKLYEAKHAGRNCVAS